jgi:nucleoside-diphosphate-sugar epimerase
MKALVTGGGGFVGKGVVKALRARGDEVVSFQRGDYPELKELGAEVFRGDIGDRDAVMKATEGCDVVFHIAAMIAGAGDPRDFERTNVDGTQHVIDACVEHGVTRLVFCSSPSVVNAEHIGAGDSDSLDYAEEFGADYPRTKAEAERRVLAANGTSTPSGPLKTIALRPHLVFGPGDTTGPVPKLLDRALKGRARIVGSGENVIDMTYIDNAVHAHILAVDQLDGEEPACAGKAYFITNGEPVQMWPWFNGLLEAIGVPPVRKQVSLGLARNVGKAFDVTWSAFRLKGEPPITEWAARVMAESHTFKIDNAKRDLGYEPVVSMAEGEKRTLPWLKQRVEAGRS